MKRIISILVTLAMMLSMFLAVIPVGAAEDANEPYLTVDSAVVSIYEKLIINAGSENANGTDWIALVPAGASTYTGWVYLKDVTENFDFFSNPAVQNADKISSGKATLYLIPDDESIKDYLDGKKTPLAKVDVFIYDDKITSVESFNGMVDTGAYILDADITLPADFVGRDFKGSLDGNGHTITLAGKTGVFATLNGATVDNLKIAGSVDATASMGALAAKVAGKVTVTNVANAATVKAKGMAAGLIADGTANAPELTLVNCSNTAYIEGSTYAGGLVGFIKGKITLDGCVNGVKDSTTTSVKGVKGTGGLIGESWGYCAINNSTNYGIVDFNGDNNWECSVGGLLGIFGNGTVSNVDSRFYAKNSFNYGDTVTLRGDWYQGVGGMVGNGKWVSSTEMYFEDCANYGDCIGGSANRGGFLGYTDNVKKLSFVRCENHGTIKSSGNNGGFEGQTTVNGEVIYTDCANYGNIVSTNNHAGGYIPWGGGTSKATFTRSFNYGKIESTKADKAASAFVTDRGSWDFTFVDCANYGEVNAKNTATCFTLGVKSTKLERCFNAGTMVGGTIYELAKNVNSSNGCVVTGLVPELAAAIKNLKIAPEYKDVSEWSDVVAAFDAAVAVYKSAEATDDAKAAALAAVNKAVEGLETYLLVDKMSVTVDGELIIDAFSHNTSGKDILAVAVGGTSDVAYWIYLADMPENFNVLSWDESIGAKVKEKVAGYYDLYIVPNDMELAQAIADGVIVDSVEGVFLSDKEISSVEDFLALEETGVYSLTTDITLPADWTAKNFAGAIEGKGHTITLTGTEGLFATLNGASLKDFTLAGDVVTTSGVAKEATGNVTIKGVDVKLKGIDFTSAFVGECVDPDDNRFLSNLVFEDCTNYSPLSANTSDDSGAMLGMADCASVVLKNCANYANVTNAHADGIAGGFVGAGNFDIITFENCVNGSAAEEITITGAMAVGGLAGDLHGTVVIKNSANYAYLTNNGNWAGGICGAVGVIANWGSKKGPDEFIVDGFTNYGRINAQASSEGCGGVAYAKPGQNFNGKWISYDIRNAVNYADIKRDGGNVAGILSTFWNTNHANTTAYFENCVNYGDISSSGNNAGIIGQYGFEGTTITLKDCKNYGDITSTGNTASGMTPWMPSGTYVFEGCVNYGTITANQETKAAAGIAHNFGASFTNCANYGLIVAQKGDAAGIASGSGGAATFTNCANYAALNGKNNFQIATNGVFTDCVDEGLTYAPVEIDSQEDFANIKVGGNYVLVNDVVLSEDYVAVDLGNAYYATTFNGNGHTITLKGAKSGLFNNLGSVTISDLTVVGDATFEANAGVIANRFIKGDITVNFNNVDVDVDIVSTKGAAAFVYQSQADAADVQNINFNDCNFYGNIDANGNTAAFIAAGDVEGAITFTDCTVGTATVRTHINAKSRVGAFIGEVWGKEKGGDAAVTLTGCTNYAALTAVKGTEAEGCVGAVAGRLCNVEAVIDGFENHGDVNSYRTTGWWQGVGGILGEVNNNTTATLKNVANFGDVYCDRSVAGGLVGAVTNNSYLTVEDSENYGDVANGSGWNMGAGGIVGGVAYKGGDKVVDANVTNTVTLKNVTNYGNVDSQNANIGGMVGMTDDSTANVAKVEAIECANYGNITSHGANNAGGMFGQMACANLIAKDCVNYGDISSPNYAAGGMSGYSGATLTYTEYTNCVNYGTVVGKNDAAAITADFDAKNGVVEGCANFGLVIGSSRAALVAGKIYKGTYSVKNNTNNGIIASAGASELFAAKDGSPAITDEANVNNGAIVDTAEYIAVAKTLASALDYAEDDWAKLVKAFADAEALLDPIVSEAEAIKYTELNFTHRKYATAPAIDQATGKITGEIKPLVIHDTIDDKISVEISDSVVAVNYTSPKEQVAFFTVADETIELNENTHYVYYVNAKNNVVGKYASVTFASVNGVPYMLYGALNNGGDNDKTKSALKACISAKGGELFGGEFCIKQDLTEDGFGQYKFVFDGLTAKCYTMANGEWTLITFKNNNSVIPLPEGAKICVGMYNRDGHSGSNRTATIANSAIAQTTFGGTVEDGLAIINAAIASVFNRGEANDIIDELYKETAGKTEGAYSEEAMVELNAAIEAVQNATTAEEYAAAKELLVAAQAKLLYVGNLNYQISVVESLNSRDWIKQSWNNLMEVYNEVKAATLDTQAKVDEAEAKLIAAIDALSPTAELWNFIKGWLDANNIRDIVEDDVVAVTWPEFAAIRPVVLELLEGNDDILLTEAYDALTAAYDKLIFVRELKDLIAELSALDEANYSAYSLTPVGAAIAVGKAAITSTTRSVIDDAVAGLKAAKEGLVDVSELVAMVEQLEKLDTSVYTPNSVAALTKALTTAKIVIVGATNADDVTAAIELVKDARSGLTEAVVINTADLEKLIAEVALLEAADYTAETWAELKDALAAAKVAVYSSTQMQVNVALRNLKAAYDALESVPVLNFNELNEYIEEARGLASADYSAETWEVLQDALAAAKAVKAAAKTQAEINAAAEALLAAIDGLADAPAEVVVDTSALEAEINKAEGYKFGEYTVETWDAFQTALTAAKIALVNGDQATVDKAAADLKAAAGALVVKPEPSEKPTEPAVVEEKGCGSAIGATVVVLTAVVGLGATVALKKKED